MVGAGYNPEYFETSTGSPNDVYGLMARYPEIQKEIDNAYAKYLLE